MVAVGQEKESGNETERPVDVGALFPIGRSFVGVKIPSYGSNKLSSIVTGDQMNRTNETDLEIDQLKIVMFNAEEKEEMILETDRGIYHLDRDILTSDSETIITGITFDMRSDSMIFDVRSEKGEMNGNVHMWIYDTSQLAGNKPAEPEATP